MLLYIFNVFFYSQVIPRKTAYVNNEFSTNLAFDPLYMSFNPGIPPVRLKGTGTRDLIWLKVVSLDRSLLVGLTDDL